MGEREWGRNTGYRRDEAAYKSNNKRRPHSELGAGLGREGTHHWRRELNKFHCKLKGKKAPFEVTSGLQNTYIHTETYIFRSRFKCKNLNHVIEMRAFKICTGESRTRPQKAGKQTERQRCQSVSKAERKRDSRQMESLLCLGTWPTVNRNETQK